MAQNDRYDSIHEKEKALMAVPVGDETLEAVHDVVHAGAWTPIVPLGKRLEDMPLNEVAGQALGSASVCWVGGTGSLVFDSEKAGWVLDGFMAHLNHVIDDIMGAMPTVAADSRRWKAAEEEFVNGVLLDTPESWDGDEAAEHIALSYVATLEARCDAAGISREKWLGDEEASQPVVATLDTVSKTVACQGDCTQEEPHDAHLAPETVRAMREGPQLGLATTEELLGELAARLDRPYPFLAGVLKAALRQMPEAVRKYRTVDGG